MHPRLVEVGKVVVTASLTAQKVRFAPTLPKHVIALVPRLFSDGLSRGRRALDPIMKRAASDGRTHHFWDLRNESSYHAILAEWNRLDKGLSLQRVYCLDSQFAEGEICGGKGDLRAAPCCLLQLFRHSVLLASHCTAPGRL